MAQKYNKSTFVCPICGKSEWYYILFSDNDYTKLFSNYNCNLCNFITKVNMKQNKLNISFEADNIRKSLCKNGKCW